MFSFKLSNRLKCIQYFDPLCLNRRCSSVAFLGYTRQQELSATDHIHNTLPWLLRSSAVPPELYLAAQLVK